MIFTHEITLSLQDQKICVWISDCGEWDNIAVLAFSVCVSLLKEMASIESNTHTVKDSLWDAPHHFAIYDLIRNEIELETWLLKTVTNMRYECGGFYETQSLAIIKKKSFHKLARVVCCKLLSLQQRLHIEKLAYCMLKEEHCLSLLDNIYTTKLIICPNIFQRQFLQSWPALIEGCHQFYVRRAA